MKTVVVSGIVIVGILVVFQVYATLSTRQTDTQPYKIIRVEMDFEIRFYPAATMAVVSSKVRTYKELGSSGFRKLAGFIFGGNEENKKIAMTSPVHMDFGDSVSTMAFVLPVGYHEGNVPKPNDPGIAIKTSEAEYLAVNTFSGFASDQKITEHIAILEKALRERGLAHYGNFRFLGYNPPWQIFGRRNEVVVAIRENEINQTNHLK
jgi:SOUL heme-binding protein